MKDSPTDIVVEYKYFLMFSTFGDMTDKCKLCFESNFRRVWSSRSSLVSWSTFNVILRNLSLLGWCRLFNFLCGSRKILVYQEHEAKTTNLYKKKWIYDQKSWIFKNFITKAMYSRLFIQSLSKEGTVTNPAIWLAPSVVRIFLTLPTVKVSWVPDFIPTFVAIFHKYISFYRLGSFFLSEVF